MWNRRRWLLATPVPFDVGSYHGYILVQSVQLRDVKVPENLQDALSRMAQAERHFYQGGAKVRAGFLNAWKLVARRYAKTKAVVGSVLFWEAYDLIAQPYLAAVYSDTAMYMTASAVADYEKGAKAQGAKALGVVERAAKGAGIRCATQTEEALQPWQGILKAARKSGCDAIVMASHGHGGITATILGSQTSRVLAHSKIPVLVIR